MSRFAIREASPDDASGIARASADSWRSSYRGLLPDVVLDRIDVVQRAEKRRQILRDKEVFQLVAYDVTHGDIVGFCDAGPARRHVTSAGEIYAIYLVQHAKRHGLGSEMFGRVRAWLRANGMPSMIVWVLDNNAHARKFYESMGGRVGTRLQSTVGGFPVIEQAYVWEHL
jgi:GNAT superfamily N-acetyltransferase